MSEDWTSSRRNGRRIDRRLRAVNSGIGPRRADIAPRISELRSQLADWVDIVREDDASKNQTKRRWTNDMPDNMIHA